MSSYNSYWPTMLIPPVVSTTKGTEIMDGLLLDQYSDKPILREFLLAYIEEMNLLFKACDDVYLGRLLPYAVGTQLDIIGKILGQNRSVEVPRQWFGFSDAGVEDPALNLAPMGDLTDVGAGGGIFQDENFAGFDVTPLEDLPYRRLLMAKAYCDNLQEVCNTEDVIYVAMIILNRKPNKLQVLDKNSIAGGLAPKIIQVNLSVEDTLEIDRALIQFAGKYFKPLGCSLDVNRN